MALREIDSRAIPGNGGRVSLIDADQTGCEYDLFVRVYGPDGSLIAEIEAESPADALDAYRHPFARPDVPDIFKRTPEIAYVSSRHEDEDA